MISLIFVIVGGSLGVTYLPSFWELIGISNEWLNSAVISVVIGAIIFFFISLILTKPIMAGFKKLEKLVNQLSVTYLVFGLLGMLLGLVVASFISLPLTNLTNSGDYTSSTSSIEHYFWIFRILYWNESQRGFS